MLEIKYVKRVGEVATELNLASKGPSVYTATLGTKIISPGDYLGLEQHYIPVVYENTVLFYIAYSDDTRLDKLSFLPAPAKSLSYTKTGAALTGIGGRVGIRYHYRSADTSGNDTPLDHSNMCKAILCGYAEIDSTWVKDLVKNAVVNSLRSSNGWGRPSEVDIKAAIADPKKIASAIQSIVANPEPHLNDGHGYIGAGQNNFLASKAQGLVVRTTKAIEDSRIRKWRKPPKGSMWPYTVDQMWYVTKESNLSQTYQMMFSLLPKEKRDNRYDASVNSLKLEYPHFDDLTQLRRVREFVQTWFTYYTEEALTNGFAPVAKSNTEIKELFAVLHQMNDTGWPIKFRQRYKEPEAKDSLVEIIVKAFVALKVRPSFKEDGNFSGFVELESKDNLFNSNEPIYVSYEDILFNLGADLDLHNQAFSGSTEYKDAFNVYISKVKQRYITGILVQLYDLGFVDKKVLDMWLPDTTDALKKKYNSSDYTHTKITDRIILCLPLVTSKSTSSPISYYPQGRKLYQVMKAAEAASAAKAAADKAQLAALQANLTPEELAARTVQQVAEVLATPAPVKAPKVKAPKGKKVDPNTLIANNPRAGGNVTAQAVRDTIVSILQAGMSTTTTTSTSPLTAKPVIFGVHVPGVSTLNNPNPPNK